MERSIDRGEKPRLLVLASTYPRWAGDHEPGFVHELARRLTDHFEVHVLAPHAPGARAAETLDGVIVKRFRYAPERLQTLVNDGGIIGNLRHHPWKWMLLPTFFLSQLAATARTLHYLRPAVVHGHWILPQGLTMALLSFRFPQPFVLTSHGADLYALRGLGWRFLKRWVCARMTAITVVSRGMCDAIEALGVPAEKVSVKPMGVDLDQRFSADARVLRQPKQLLFVGRLVEKKGLRYLLEALPRVLEQHPEVTLVIAGFGPEEATLKALSAKLGIDDRVTFLGAVTQEALPALYRQAGLFVAPFTAAKSGDQEGLGLVLVEALGCGCPVLAGDVPAVRDVLPEQGQRVPPADPVALAEAITALLSQSAEERAERYRPLRLANRKRFGWQPVSEGYARLLHDARERRPG